MAEPGFPQRDIVGFSRKQNNRKVEDRLYDGDIRLNKTSG